MEINAFLDALMKRAAAAGLEKCEAQLSSGESFEASVFGGRVIDYNVSAQRSVAFRALVNGHMGHASTQSLDEDALDMLVDGARENAALIESRDEQFLYEGGEAYPELNVYNPDLARLSAADKLEMALELERRALKQDARIAQVDGCAAMYTEGEHRIVNSAGLNLCFRDNALGGYIAPVARQGERAATGMEFAMVRERSRLDLDAMARVAAQQALLGLEAEPVASGEYRIVLRNDAAAGLLGAFSGIFSADAAQKGLSALLGCEGKLIAAPAVTLMDAPLDARGLCARPFDGEGAPCRNKAVIRDGKLETLLHNLKTAHKQGVKTTGNATSAGVAPSNLFFAPSALTLDQLTERANGGLLITELQGMHAGANAISGDFSLSAKGFLIENGRPGRPVHQITVAGNFYELLKHIEAVGGDLRFAPPGVSCIGSPSLLAGTLSVAGG